MYSLAIILISSILSYTTIAFNNSLLDLHSHYTENREVVQLRLTLQDESVMIIDAPFLRIEIEKSKKTVNLSIRYLD